MYKEKKLEEAEKNRTDLVPLTDWSKLNQGCIAAAFCWKNKKSGYWKAKNSFLRMKKEIIDIEL